MTSLSALLDLYGQEESVRLESDQGKYAPKYRLEIEREGKVTQISFDELATPPSVAPLVEYLSERARPMDL